MIFEIIKLLGWSKKVHNLCYTIKYILLSKKL